MLPASLMVKITIKENCTHALIIITNFLPMVKITIGRSPPGVPGIIITNILPMVKTTIGDQSKVVAPCPNGENQHI